MDNRLHSDGSPQSADQLHPEKAADKKYVTPRLTEYGTFAQLTKGGPSGIGDGSLTRASGPG
jgi:hypothetical protein